MKVIGQVWHRRLHVLVTSMYTQRGCSGMMIGRASIKSPEFGVRSQEKSEVIVLFAFFPFSLALPSARRAPSYAQVLPFKHTAQAALVSRSRITCARACGLRASLRLLPSSASGS